MQTDNSQSHGGIKRTAPTPYDLTAELVGLTDQLSKQSGRPELPTGIRVIDERCFGLHAGNILLLAARPGSGKCLGFGTKILMFDGSIKTVENVVVGDLLMGPDSKPRTVQSLARGSEMMYRIEQNRGYDYECNESHILALKKSGSEKYVEISVADYLKKSAKFKHQYKGYKAQVEFMEKELPIDPYFVGLWLGDGSSHKPSISKPDVEIFDYLEAYAESLDMCVSFYDMHRCPMINIINKPSANRKHNKLLDMMRLVGLINNKHIPEIYKVNSRENRLKLLAGLIDSDGYGCRGGGIEFSNTNKQLIDDVEFVARSLGFHVNVRKVKTRIKSIGFVGEAYRMMICGKLSDIPLKLKRKASKDTTYRSSLVCAINVVPIGIGNYYGFELDGDGLFLLGDFTVTHNTSAMLQMGFHLAKNGKKVCIVSLEMSVRQVLGRLIAIEESIDLFGLQRTPGEHIPEFIWSKLAKFGNTLQQIPKDKFHIVDDYGFTGEEINRLLEYFYIKKPDVILIDHIQHIQFENKKAQEAIDNYMLILKEFAKKNHTSIVVLSQINREGAEKPTMGHLKSSGKLEEISDTVILIHNDPVKTEENNCTFIIAKQRFGPVGEGLCYFSGHETKFYNDYEEYKIKLSARQKTVNIAKDFKTYIARANKESVDPLDALVERDCEV